jgi:3D-(3,5/4)-trihydroxycyclohexane-1,2-dione acylhydrolase (decyclizing)
MNSDIYSSVLTGHKLIVVVCDNGGFAVIDRLQNFKGGASFNNYIRDSRLAGEPFAVDFAAHARAMGAQARRVQGIGDLEDALEWARGTDRTTVIALETDGTVWTPGDAWWDLGVPEVSAREAVRDARAEHEAGRTRQRIGV